MLWCPGDKAGVEASPPAPTLSRTDGGGSTGLHGFGGSEYQSKLYFGCMTRIKMKNRFQAKLATRLVVASAHAKPC